MDTQHSEHYEMGDEKKMWRMKHREHIAVRALIAVIVIIFVFWCGFEFGEIRASVGFGHGYGYRTMQSGFSGGNIMYGGTTMRQVLPPAPTNTSASANSASAK